MPRAKNDKVEWNTPAIYPMGRTAEFVIVALGYSHDRPADGVTAESLVIEYVTEAEHQDGAEYWNQFPYLSDAIEDFVCYIQNKE